MAGRQKLSGTDPSYLAGKEINLPVTQIINYDTDTDDIPGPAASLVNPGVQRQ